MSDDFEGGAAAGSPPGLMRVALILAGVLLVGAIITGQSWQRSRAQNAAVEALAPDGRPIAVKFSATWCGPCRAYAPVFEEVTKGYEGRLRVLDVDIDRQPDLARRFGVSAIPATVFLDGSGAEVDRVVGGMDAGMLSERLASATGLTP